MKILRVITRWYGGEHLGVARFDLMRDLVDQIVNDIEKQFDFFGTIVFHPYLDLVYKGKNCAQSNFRFSDTM